MTKEIDYSFMQEIGSRETKPLHDIQREQANEIKRLKTQLHWYELMILMLIAVTAVTIWAA